MVRVVHTQQTQINMDYVNQPAAPTRNLSDKQTKVYPGEKLIRVVAVSFGLLCVLQAAVNISLRLVLYNQISSGPQPVCQNVTTDINGFRKQSAQYFQQGWVYLHPSFYYISSTKQSWENSRLDCLQRGADLVIINSKKEQNFIRQFNRLTWIGLRNITNQWTWVDGTPLNKDYWGPSEPNSFEGKTEECVEIRFFDIEDSWNDIPCTDLNFWICEKKMDLLIKPNLREFT
ncbi:C-type lectin domain family 4 member M [Austrofundulus limnaeus]|uniref:C-type lectin domain family 4 member M n=1 Tax=Austrofundulus limnaeus TaxID=52670 RepID=A0A2I4C3V3_AUSLI|nr:PREDICTED: C-type lectin domain family 4 member M-like [Austrofundulus limnaeus]